MSKRPPQRPHRVYILHNSVRTVLLFRVSYIKVLLAEGFEVVCIAFDDDAAASKKLLDMGITLIPIKRKNLVFKAIELNFRYFNHSRLACRSSSIICHFISTAALALPILVVNRNDTCFIEGVGTFFTGRPRFTACLSWFLLNFINRRVFMNSYERDLLGAENDKVLNGIGIDVSKFSLPPSNVDGNPAKNTANTQSLQILFVGRLVSDKGIHDVLQVLRGLRQRGVDAQLTLVGEPYPGNPGNFAQENIDEAIEEFSDSVQFVGQQTELVSYYQEADVLLLLSKHEGFPVVVMEANACGTPVIVYDVPGCRDAVTDGVNGFIFELGAIDSVVDCLGQQQFSLLQEGCRRVAEQRFDVDERSEFVRQLVLDSIKNN